MLPEIDSFLWVHKNEINDKFSKSLLKTLKNTKIFTNLPYPHN